jgi:cytochrome c
MRRDLWERGKVAAAIALACVTLAGSSFIAYLIAGPSFPQQRGYAINGVPPVDLARAQRAWPSGEDPPGSRETLLGYVRNIGEAKVPVSAAAQPADPVMPMNLGALLAAAEPDRGKRTAQICASCHTFGPGEPNRVGPNLYGIVGRKVASHAGFSYSASLARAGGRWTYEALDRFLSSPARAVPGTKMSFAGLRNPQNRAQVIAYLAEITPAAPPFPEPAPDEPPAR